MDLEACAFVCVCVCVRVCVSSCVWAGKNNEFGNNKWSLDGKDQSTMINSKCLGGQTAKTESDWSKMIGFFIIFVDKLVQNLSRYFHRRTVGGASPWTRLWLIGKLCLDKPPPLLMHINETHTTTTTTKLGSLATAGIRKGG